MFIRRWVLASLLTLSLASLVQGEENIESHRGSGRRPDSNEELRVGKSLQPVILFNNREFAGWGRTVTSRDPNIAIVGEYRRFMRYALQSTDNQVFLFSDSHYDWMNQSIHNPPPSNVIPASHHRPYDRRYSFMCRLQVLSANETKTVVVCRDR